MNQNRSEVYPPHSWIEQEVVHNMANPRGSRLRGNLASPAPAQTEGMIGNERKLKVCHSYALLTKPTEIQMWPHEAKWTRAYE